MKVGVALFYQNYYDWDRYDAKRFDEPPQITDAQIYEEELYLGGLIEPLGFDSIWAVEHHHTPYTMIPDPTQLLSYFAGKTSRVNMGTMVMVLPWHNPLHVAENISLLDHLLGEGREFIVGFGRGASAKEFKPLGQPMEESRERFMESLEIVRKALTQERFSHQGKYWNISETSVRPRPRSSNITDNLYCAWGSPQTLAIAANAGLGMLFIPMKSWEEYRQDVQDFNAIRESNGWKPVQPKVVAWVYCSEDEADAVATGREYMGNYWDSAGRHYGFADPQAFKDVKGYEHYNKMAEEEAQRKEEQNQEFADSQVYGTPEQCVQKLKVIQDTTSASEFIGVFRYGGMPLEAAEKSMRLFSEKVLPEIQKLETSAVSAKA